MKKVLIECFVSINTNDLSASSSSVELAAEIEEQDATTFASEGWMESLGGLGSGSLSLTFKQDYDAGQVDSIMWPLFIARIPVPFAVRASQAARSTSNPEYAGNILINQWNPLTGEVGDIAEAEVEFPLSGKLDRLTV